MLLAWGLKVIWTVWEGEEVERGKELRKKIRGLH